jgi:hypothetical protein
MVRSGSRSIHMVNGMNHAMVCRAMRGCDEWIGDAVGHDTSARDRRSPADLYRAQPRDTYDNTTHFARSARNSVDHTLRQAFAARVRDPSKRDRVSDAPRRAPPGSRAETRETSSRHCFGLDRSPKREPISGTFRLPLEIQSRGKGDPVMSTSLSNDALDWTSIFTGLDLKRAMAGAVAGAAAASLGSHGQRAATHATGPVNGLGNAVAGGQRSGGQRVSQAAGGAGATGHQTGQSAGSGSGHAGGSGGGKAGGSAGGKGGGQSNKAQQADKDADPSQADDDDFDAMPGDDDTSIAGSGGSSVPTGMIDGGPDDSLLCGDPASGDPGAGLGQAGGAGLAAAGGAGLGVAAAAGLGAAGGAGLAAAGGAGLAAGGGDPGNSASSGIPTGMIVGGPDDPGMNDYLNAAPAPAGAAPDSGAGDAGFSAGGDAGGGGAPEIDAM